MSTSKRNRFIVVAGIIVIVVIAAAAFLSAGTTATVMTVEQASAADAHGKKVQVEGAVIDNSYTIDGDVLTFKIGDAANSALGAGDAGDAPELTVVYDKGVASTFGNGVTAICTGTIDQEGVLHASELITKCPSKYETATDALSVSRLLGYGVQIVDKPVKVTGAIVPGSLSDVSAKVRFSIADPEAASDGAQSAIEVAYAGALPEEAQDGAVLVLTGSLDATGQFTATDVALAEESAR